MTSTGACGVLPVLVNQAEKEQASGERFAFGKNWQRFLTVLDDNRIAKAEESLAGFLETASLKGKTFIDVGSGSGLFSLAARRMGARVISFDYDPQSVACTAELKRRYFDGDPEWSVLSGSVLDEAFLGTLGTFDVVYSWGVLHHTGRMWEALRNVDTLVAPGGKLYIAIYNDQGSASIRWRSVKRLYNRSGAVLRKAVLLLAFVRLWGPTMARGLLKGHPLRPWQTYGGMRGMSPWHDVVDWVGGYPFEVAKPEQIFEFFRARGCTLQSLKTCGGGMGCNEFVFLKAGADAKA